MKKELHDPGSIAVKMLFHVDDRAKPRRPDVSVKGFLRQLLGSEDFRMHADNKDFLVIRPVEDSNTASLRQAHCRSPEEIMCEILSAGVLETEHLTALRIHARHHVLYGAIFAGSIHCLE